MGENNSLNNLTILSLFFCPKFSPRRKDVTGILIELRFA